MLLGRAPNQGKISRLQARDRGLRDIESPRHISLHFAIGKALDGFLPLVR
jgi:hypothetical protein